MPSLRGIREKQQGARVPAVSGDRPTTLLSLDTETTGVDLRHGAKPFFVTICRPDGTQTWWEWDVDPLTREPMIPAEDLAHITHLTIDRGAGTLVLQNAKFDVRALGTLKGDFSRCWRWADTHDTLIGAHLLASNRPKDLTSLALQYLNVNIQPLEDKLKVACETARRYCRTNLKDWAIAKEGRPDMPSAKEKVWKYDTWLLKAVLREVGVDRLSEHYGEDLSWWGTALRDYANADSAVTVAVWQVMEKEIRRRNLWDIYECRRQAVPLAFELETRGVTLSKARLDELTAAFRRESEACGAVCVNIAAGMGHQLDLPKNGVNQSLRTFCFDGLDLEPIHSKKAKTDAPTLDKEAFRYYEESLPPFGRALGFVKSLVTKRKRDTSLQYMEGYQRFWKVVPGEEGWYRLHPSFNPTGTDTLRWSSQNPNAQNISKQEGLNLRYCFGPAPGREWWSLDAKNIELRLPAYESGEEDLIALFERPDDPPYYGSNHILVFHLLWPELWDAAAKEVGPDKAGPYCKKKYASTYYQWVKNGNFAVQYGAVDRADGKGTADLSYHQAGAQAKVKARFAKQEALNQHWIRFADRHGYVETIPDRSVDPARGYPVLCTRTEYGKILPTVPLNYHIQSSAMWWTHKAMVRCAPVLEQWRRERFNAWMTMQVHDELVFDLPRGAHPKDDPSSSNLGRVRHLQREMERGGEDYGIPTPVGVEWHPVHWGEGVTV